MNTGAAKAARADMRFRGLDTAKVPRKAKRLWSTLNHKQRGRLRASWKRKMS